MSESKEIMMQVAHNGLHLTQEKLNGLIADRMDGFQEILERMHKQLTTLEKKVEALEKKVI